MLSASWRHERKLRLIEISVPEKGKRIAALSHDTLLLL